MERLAAFSGTLTQNPKKNITTADTPNESSIALLLCLPARVAARAGVLPRPIGPSVGAAAKQRVTAWVNATHSGLDALAAKAEVIELRYAKGSGFDPVHHSNEVGLTSGWAKGLLETGRTTVSGTALDLGTGN
jgi:hypothetical protein